MKTKLMFATLMLGTIVTNAQTNEGIEYADPALRSPVVAVEFTGQRCRYCPNLSRALKGSEEKYGKDNYIITALHSLERFSLLPSQHVSLFNAEATEYATNIDVHDGLPQLVYNTLGPIVSDHLLDEMFEEDDLLECTGSVWFNDRNEYVIDVQTRLRRNQLDFVEGKSFDILFWALENDIVALQDDNGSWTYPAHQHIFRGSINGTWGESFQLGRSYRKSWPVPSSVSVLDNSEVVVFFLDHETKTIHDAGRFKVSKLDATGVGQVASSSKSPVSTLYDLNGRLINRPESGKVYIQEGKKFIKK